MLCLFIIIICISFDLSSIEFLSARDTFGNFDCMRYRLSAKPPSLAATLLSISITSFIRKMILKNVTKNQQQHNNNNALINIFINIVNDEGSPFYRLLQLKCTPKNKYMNRLWISRCAYLSTICMYSALK